MKKLIPSLLLLIFGLVGCAGGGGCVHLPPGNIKAGDPIELHLELIAWGAGSGKLDRRYTQIKCHYRDAAKPGFQVVDATVLSVDESRMKTVMIIRPETVAGAEQIEYYFDFLFDEVYNRRNEAPLRLQNSSH